MTSVPLRRLLKPSDECDRPDLEVLSVYREHGVIPKSSRTDNFNVTPTNLGRYLHVRPGDLVVNKMKAWSGSLGVSSYEGIVSADYLVARPMSSNLVGDYLHYVLRSAPYIAEMRSRSRGIRPNQERLYWDDLAQMTIPLREVEQQRRLADFLDEQIARIDEAIRLRNEQKDSVALLVSDARERLFVSAKSEWVPLKWITTKIGSGKTPTGGADVYRDDGVAFLRSQNVHFDGLRLSDVAFISDELDREMRGTRVQMNDVLLNITGGSIGRAAVMDQRLRANVNQHVCIIRLADPGLSVFVGVGLGSKAVQEQIGLCQVGGNREGLNFSQVGSLRVPLPPLENRRQLASELASLSETAKHLEVEMSAQVAALHERKASMITAAVTGQSDNATTICESVTA